MHVLLPLLLSNSTPVIVPEQDGSQADKQGICRFQLLLQTGTNTFP